jgi:outer membrane protein assembly factor BamB
VRIRTVIVIVFLLGSILSIFSPSVISDEDDSAWVMIDFGNGNVEWAEVEISENNTAIIVTEDACESLDLSITVIWSFLGAFVSEIGGVTPSGSWWWGFFIWNHTSGSWEDSQIGAYELELEDEDIIGWSPAWDWMDPVPPTPTPSAKYPWMMFQHDSTNSGYLGRVGPDSNSIEWVFNTETIELTASAAIAHNKVVINNWGGVFCLDLEGNLLWKNKDVVGGFSPAISSNSVFVGGKDGFLYSLNLTSGKSRWRTKIADHPGLSGVTSSPTLDKGKVYVGTFNFSGGPGGLICLDAKSGFVIWEKETPGSVYFSSPAVYMDRVFVGIMGLYNSSSLQWKEPYGFFCYDSSDGDLLWNVSAEGSVGSSATIFEDNILFTSKDGFLYCLAQSDGDLKWKKEIGSSVSSPAVSDEKIFVGTGEMNREGRFLCLGKDGDTIWEFLPNGAVQGSPAIAEDLVYFGTNVKKGTIYCLNKDNGNLIWQYEVWPEQYIISSPSISDERMYIASDNGRLYCFGGETPSVNVSDSDGFHDVNFGEDVIIYYEGIENKLNIVTADQDKVILKLESLSGNVEVPRGRAYRFDSDSDGERDLEIFVEQVNTTSQTVSLSLDTFKEPPEREDERVFPIILITILIIVVLMIAGIAKNKKRRP